MSNVFPKLTTPARSLLLKSTSIPFQIHLLLFYQWVMPRSLLGHFSPHLFGHIFKEWLEKPSGPPHTHTLWRWQGASSTLFPGVTEWWLYSFWLSTPKFGNISILTYGCLCLATAISRMQGLLHAAFWNKVVKGIKKKWNAKYFHTIHPGISPNRNENSVNNSMVSVSKVSIIKVISI